MLPVVTDYQALYKQYKRAREQVAKGAEEPVLVVKNIEHSAALAFADKLECRGFSFVPSESQRGIGSLYFFVDTSYIHELVSHEVTSSSSMYLMPWALPVFEVLVPSGATREEFGGGFQEPDQSFYVVTSSDKLILTTVVEVAYALSRSSLLQRMRDWVGPGGPARVAIGVDIKHRGPKGEMPRIEVMLQLRGQSSPSATVQCGADSGCCSPGMYDSTLFVPVNELLFGSPWFLRLLISMQLAVVVPLVGVVLGGLFAARDVLRGRRSLASVASSCLRSLRGPWWGVVPLDTYRIRSRVLMAMKNMD